MDTILKSYTPTLCRLISDHQAACELAWHVVCYLSVAGYHTRRSVPQYNTTFKKSSSLPLAIHTICALIEIFRYHIKALYGPVMPTPLDAMLCLLHSVTNLELARTLMRGRPKPSRAGYQSFAILRAGISVAAVVWGDAHLHRAAIKCLDSFIYTRVCVFLFSYFNVLDSYADIYSLSTYLATVMVLWEGGLPLSSLHALNAMALGFVGLNRWVSNQADQLEKNKGTPSYPLQGAFVGAMVYLGFAELRTVRSWQGTWALSQEIEDDYIDTKATAPALVTPDAPSSPLRPQLGDRRRSGSSYPFTRRLSGFRGFSHNMHGHVSSTGH